jgi:hypothetical protein
MIREARYTSPSGKEAAFGWETTKRDTELKTGVFTFPGKDGANVQHQGAGARTFPLVCIFSGDNYTARADEFEAMLIERGVAELQHPVYGTIKVKPVGHIEREDDPVKKLGQATVTVTFTETLTGEDAAELNEVAADSINEKYDEFSEAAAADFAEAIAGDSTGKRIADTGGGIQTSLGTNTSEQLAVQAALETQTQSIIDSLQPLAASDKKGFADWLASAKELKGNIKNLYAKGKNIAASIESVYTKALNIARLTLRLMKLPSTIAVSLAEKIKGYSTLTANLINQYKNDPFGIKKIKAAYMTATLALTGAVAAIASGSALTVAEIAAMTGAASTGISDRDNEPANINLSRGAISRKEVIEASEQITALLDSVNIFKDEKITAMETSGEDTRAAIQTIDDTITFMGETAEALKSAITTEVPPEVARYVNEIIHSKDSEIQQLQESLGRSAGRSAAILENAIEFEQKKKAQIEAAGGQESEQILQIIGNSLDFENASKNKLKSIAGNAAGNFVDSTPVSYLALHELVYTSVLLIINASFALPMQKTITLDRDRQVIELCAELYGTTDYLDEFIMENNLNIDEIELLPMGKKVSYYVKNA